MTKHIDAAGISRLVAGDANDADRAHVDDCPACRHEVEQFERTLRAFRVSLREWSAEELAAAELAPPPPAAGRPRLQAAFSMAVVLVLSIMGWQFSLRQQAPRPVPPPAFDADAELLIDVSVAVRRPVPRDLEPLLMRP